MKKELCLLALAASFGTHAADVAPSRVNPGNFPVERVPQFVCIGSDDNYNPDGFKFFIDTFKGKSNKTEASPQAETFDGAPARMSFHVNTNNGNGNAIGSKGGLVGYMKDGLASGHEIGNHTRTHATSSSFTLSQWTTEIENMMNDLPKVGISKSVVSGFRTPYLAYNEATFKALDADKQFRYDCSIRSGHDDASDGTNFIWPYTLDNGPFASDVPFEPEGVSVGKHPGLWEVPVYAVIVPPALRHQVWVNRVQKVNGTTYTAVFDTGNGKVTGMDYNILSGPSNYGGLGLDSAQYASTLKHTLDLHLKGNRAPFCFAVHSNIFYDQTGWSDEGNTSYNGPGAKPPKATVAQARGAVADFLAYALSQPEVRVVTMQNLIDWCTHPTALAASTGVRAAPHQFMVRAAGGRVTILGLPEGEVTLSLYTLAGRPLERASGRGPVFTWRPEKVPAGAYLLRIRGPGFARAETLSL